MRDQDETDYAGRGAAEFVGRRVIEQGLRATIIGGYVDACDILLMTLRFDNGQEVPNFPLDTLRFIEEETP